MPIIQLKVSAQPSADLTRQLTQALLEHTTGILHKRRELTAITIDYVPPAQWLVGGATLAELKQSSFYFDIKVVDETNTKQEKAHYISACFASLAALLGDLHPESYIHVHDVRASAYGYGGRTQEFRHQHPQPVAA